MARGRIIASALLFLAITGSYAVAQQNSIDPSTPYPPIRSGDIQQALLSADPSKGRLTISSFLQLC